MHKKQWLVAGLVALNVGVVGSVLAQAQVKIEDPWVRGTVAQQKASGAFMRLTAPQDMRLVSASSLDWEV